MALQPGQMLSHYRLVEKIGEGGMGVVWKGHDSRLNRHVAIKVLPPELVGDQERRHRFMREARAAAAVTHASIASIYDIGEVGETTFLVMELVEGRTLRSIITGRSLELSEALRIGSEISEGLSRAHQARIVHRDLKPENIIIGPDGHAKILDFGLAKLLEERDVMCRSLLSEAETVSEELTREGKVLGTPAYMSPEQARGEAVDTRSDLFSFGAMLYEMVTSRIPFAGRSNFETLSAILHQPVVAASQHNAEVPEALDRMLHKCLEKSPAARYQHADELVVDLRRLTKELEAGSAPSYGTVTPSGLAASSRQKRWLWPSIAGVVAVALVATAVIVLRGRSVSTEEEVSSAPTTASVDLRQSVAVLGFKNLAGREDKAWLSTALSELLSTELAAGGEIRTIPGEAIAEMKINLSLAEADSYTAETLSRIRGQVGSGFVVAGTFLTLGDASGGQLRLDLRLQDAAAGETVVWLSETGSEADLLDLVTKTGARLREELGAAATTAEERAALRATIPGSAAAARAYSEGLDLLRRLDALGARERLEEAAAIEPDHPMILSALADAHSQLGYEAKAVNEAERAFQYSGNLPERQRLEVEGRYRAVRREWDRAIQIYRTIWEAGLDDLDAGLRLANAQIAGGEAEEALQTVGALRALPDRVGDDPRVDLAERRALFVLGRYERSLEAATRAVEKAKLLKARLLEAQALFLQGYSLSAMGRNDEALATVEAALRIYRDAGHRRGEARSLDVLAYVLGVLDRFDESRARLEEAGQIHRETGNRVGEASVLHSLAESYALAGELARAKEMYESVLAIYSQINARPRLRAIAQMQLGRVMSSLGDLREGAAHLERALSIFREVGDRREGVVLQHQAGFDLFLGEIERAEERATRALELAGESAMLRASALGLIGWVRMHEDRLGEARESLEKTRKLLRESGAGSWSGWFDLSLAELEAVDGTAERAAALAREALGRQPSTDLTLRAGAVLAHAQAEGGQREEAERDLRAAATRLRGLEAVGSRLYVALHLAYAARALGRADEARQFIEQHRVKAEEVGAIPWQLEAGILVATLDLAAGDTASARAALKAIEDDARARGLAWLARKASEAAAAPH